MPTVTKSLTAISLSCLVEGLDEEAVDVENRAENSEKARREVIVLQQCSKLRGRRDE
jgi:hypothetical protein